MHSETPAESPAESPAPPRRTLPGVLYVVALVLMGVAVVGFLSAARHTFLQTDDYCMYGRLFARHGNPFAETAYLYTAWTGRFSAVFLITIPGTASYITPTSLTLLYRVFVFLFLASFPVAAYALVRTLDPGRVANAALALLATLAVLLLTPLKVVTLYWLTGSVVYFVSVSALFVLAVLLHREYTSRASRPLPMIATVLMFGAIAGFNELIGLSAGVLLFAYLAVGQGRGIPLAKHLLLFASYVGAMAISILAPGNFKREETTGAEHDVFQAIGEAWDSMTLLWRGQVVDNKWLVLVLIGGAVVIGLMAGRNGELPTGRLMLPAAVTLLSAPLVHAVAYSYIAGEPSPARVLNQALAMFWPGLLILVAWATARAAATKRAEAGTTGRILAGVRHPAVLPLALVAVAVFLLASDEFRDFNEIRTEYGPVWEEENEERDELLEQAADAGLSDVVVPAFTTEPEWPPVLQGADVTADPSHWINQCVATFYGVQQVTVADA